MTVRWLVSIVFEYNIKQLGIPVLEYELSVTELQTDWVITQIKEPTLELKTSKRDTRCALLDHVQFETVSG